MSEAKRIARLNRVDEAHLARIGRGVGSILRAGDVLVLNGPLGAGKTTFTRSLGEGLGVRGPVTSPTFVLARTHPSVTGGAPLIHVDAYRLSDPIELDDLDLDVDASVTVVEWGRDWAHILSDHWVEIELRAEDIEALAEAPADASADETRTLTVTAHGRGPAIDDLAARVESQLV